MKPTMRAFYQYLSTDLLLRRRADAIRDLAAGTVTVHILAKTRPMMLHERIMTQDILAVVTRELTARKAL